MVTKLAKADYCMCYTIRCVFVKKKTFIKRQHLPVGQLFNHIDLQGSKAYLSVLFHIQPAGRRCNFSYLKLLYKSHHILQYKIELYIWR